MRFIASALLLLGTSMLAGPVLASDPAFEEEQAAMAELEALTGDDFEIAYVNAIIAHHQSALDMAEAVVDRVPHTEAREAAEKIISDQRDEIEMLTSFLKDTYGQDPAPDPRMMMPESMMQELESASPARAEALFLLMMREHHQTAIEMGMMAQEKAESEMLLDQASMMITTQQQEQAQFAEWLSEWYRIDAPEPTGHMAAVMDLAADLPDTATAVESQQAVSPLLIALGALLIFAGAWSFAVVQRRRAEVHVC